MSRAVSETTIRRDKHRAWNLAEQLAEKHAERLKSGSPIPSWIRIPYHVPAAKRVAVALMGHLLSEGWMVAARETGPDRSSYVDGKGPPAKGWLRISISAPVDRHQKTPAADTRTPEEKARDQKIVELAKEKLYDEGTLEIDDNAVVSEGDDNGAYVQAWAWLDFDNTEFNKEKEDDDD